MIEIGLLKAFLNRDNFEAYRELLNPKSLSKESLVLLKDFEVYYAQNPDKKNVSLSEWGTFFFQVRHPYLDDKSVESYKEIFRLIQESDLKKEIDQLVSSFKQQECYEEVRQLLQRNADIEELENKVQEIKKEISTSNIQNLFPEMDIIAALEYTDRSNGLMWRCKALRDCFKGGIITSDFGIIAGFVDSGKTSFIASELSYMGQQLKDDEYILWMSNEGSHLSIIPRLYCAALNCDANYLREKKLVAAETYTKLMNGNKNRVQILDIQGWSAKQIEGLIKKRTPKLLVIDLVDHIAGFDKYSNQESSFEKYGKLYQWCREISTQYCPLLGVSQLRGDGEDCMYPRMSQLRASKIDKPAAATFILMIGSLVGDETNRFLSIPKSKIEHIKNWRAAVKFDSARCRYI